jgi:Predicted metal-dependent hydrolase of the TIM-barrel fold
MPNDQERTLQALPLFIDVHCHVFNGEDIDVAGFLNGPVASHNKLFRPLLRSLAERAADIVYRKAPSGTEELAMLAACGARGGPAMENGLEAPADARTRDADLTRELARELAEADDGDLQRQLGALELDATTTRPAAGATGRAGITEPQLRQLLAEPAGESLEAANERMPKGVFGLIKRLCSRRSDNVYWLASTYADSTPPATLFMPALVDYNHWLGSAESRTLIADQVDVAEQIAVATGGSILPYAPYNPWTDIVADDASLSLVKEAVCERGFVGVKIYPPMGYQPYGNATLPPAANWPELPGGESFGSLLDRKLLALYTWCREEDVPILTHSSPSQGVTRVHDEYAGPVAWRKALAKCPGLRVCLGHFGGDIDSREDKERDWGGKFLELMETPGAENLYADVSYLAGLLTGKDAVEDLLTKALTSQFAERLMYGTDWHLLMLEHKAAAYATTVAAYVDRNFSDPAATRLRHSLFYGTAVEFYGLRKGQQTRKRLDAFYAKHGVAKPAWAAAVDSLPVSLAASQRTPATV